MDWLQLLYELLNISSAREARGWVGFGILFIAAPTFFTIITLYGFPEQFTDPREDFRKHPIISWSIVGAIALVAILYFGALLMYPGVL